MEPEGHSAPGWLCNGSLFLESETSINRPGHFYTLPRRVMVLIDPVFSQVNVVLCAPSVGKSLLDVRHRAGIEVRQAVDVGEGAVACRIIGTEFESHRECRSGGLNREVVRCLVVELVLG